MQAICQVCGSSEWWDLPDPIEGQAVTSAGRIIGESLGKAQCAQCGFVQRTHARFLGHTDFYERDYATYYDRPGAAEFHAARYRVLAEWMESALRPFSPSRIMDVGCGQGWALEAMKSLYPTAVIEGLEPSKFNNRAARQRGFTVYETRLENAALPQATYDLVYSNNVIQHVTNARQFIASVTEMVSKDGAIVITCPDASVPNIEMLWGDQNFSFLPANLLRLCGEFHFETIAWFPSPPSPSLPPAQMLLLSKNRSLWQDHSGRTLPAIGLGDAYRSKCEYLKSFRKIDAYICSRINGHPQIHNFGASYWSSVLSAYCPEYWERVFACVVDRDDNLELRPFDKKVLKLSAITPEDGVMVLGTSPSTHNRLVERFSATWKDVVAWNQFISC